MRKFLLSLLSMILLTHMVNATTCPNAQIIPATPTFPYTQSLVCGTGNDINDISAPGCGTTYYLGGTESVYTWTPATGYTSVTIAYTGVTWSGIFVYAGCPTSGGTCVGNFTDTGDSKTLSIPALTAGVTYYIVFDTWPTPNSPCPGTFTLNGTMSAPLDPGALVQDPAAVTCATGSSLTATGTPAVGTSWYWQTTASGTSTANPYAGSYAISANGTYYLRAYSASLSAWSVNSSSIVVSNFPTATAPASTPIAAQNPSCAPTGTTLVMASAPSGFVYYWQGTNPSGSSMTNNASSPYTVTSSGTYYVNAYETATSCWSTSVSTAITVNTVIPPAPVVTTSNYNYCTGAVTAPITANNPILMSNATCTVTATASGTDNSGVTATLNNFTCATGTITGVSMTASVGTYNPQWYSYNIMINGATVLTMQPNQTLDLTSYMPITSVSIVSTDSDSFGDFVTLNLSVTLTYSIPAAVQPAYTISWFDAASAGNNVGTGSPFETIGTSVIPTAVQGTYSFYAQTGLGGCTSAARSLVTVNVADVNATLTPVNATCNGANNGSFALGTVSCGTAPFLYSVNGGAFGAIPTNLTAGTYSVIIKDNALLLSSPISVIVTQPAVPSAIAFSNITYFTADVAWVTTGNETSWTIEYGPVGFTPGSGTTVTALASPFNLTGLAADTDYDVYITPVCGTSPQSAGPVVLSTKSGFFTSDNACGPGFIDISATGTNLNLTDDSEAGITLPWPWTINGVTVNTVTVGNNGGVLFNTLTGQVGYTATGNGMFPYVQDLGTPFGGVYYKSIGTAPNRQFIILWDNVPAYAGTDGSTFEIIVDEATNDVYYIYDDVLMANVLKNYGADAEITLNTSNGNVVVSMNNATYLTNNSCVHFYNALCPNPVVQTATVTQEQIDIDWNAGAYNETEWTVIYGPVGFDPVVSGTTVSTTNSNISISGLTQLTEYDVYIYSECALENLTSGGLLVNYTTLPWCKTPTGLGGSTAVDSIFSTWNFTPVVGSPQPLTGFNIQYGEYGFDLYGGSLHVATGTNNADTIPTSLLAGGVYQIYVQSVCGTDTSNYAGPFTVVAPLTNNAVCAPQMLNVDGTVYMFNNTGATAQPGEAALITGSNPAGYNATNLPKMTWGSPLIEGSTWFQFVAPPSGSLWFSGLDQNQFASQIAVYEVANCADFNSFVLVGASDQVNDLMDTKVAPHFTLCGLTPGSTYYILHDAWSNGFGDLPIYGQYSIKMTEIVLEAGSYVDVINVCTGSSVELFDGITGYDAGGTWTATVTSLNQGITDSIFNSAGFAYSDFQFQYKVQEGCAYDSVLTQVKIYPPSSAGTNGQINVCKNQPFNLLSALTGVIDLGGTWYNSSNVALPSGQITTGTLPGQFNYNYIVSNGVCPNDTSNIIVNVSATCNYAGIDELVADGISVHPNPSTGIFYISNTDATQNFNYEVLDLNGRVVIKAAKEINGTSTVELNLTKVENGTYMVRLFNENGSKLLRIVKQ